MVHTMSIRCLLLSAGLALFSIHGAALAQETAAEASGEEVEAKAAEAEAEKRPSGIYFQYALFYAPQPEGGWDNLMQRAQAVFNGGFERRFTYRGGVVKFDQGNYVEFRQVEAASFPPPSVDYLEHKGFGLSKTERDRIQDSESVLVIDFFIVAPQDYQYLNATNALAGALAEGTGGFIWDEETKEMHSVAAWRQKRLSNDPVYFANTSMHAYELASKNFRSVTFGMRKLGLPDLVLAEFPRAFWDPLSEMMRFLVAQVGSRGPLNPKLSWSAAELRQLLNLGEAAEVPDLWLTEAPRDEGDPRNDLYTVDFRSFPGESYQEKQMNAIGTLFRPDGPILELWKEREKLLELSEAARAALKEKKALLVAGLPEGERLLAKVFEDQEYLWLDLESWSGTTLRGRRVPDVTPEGTLAPVSGDVIRVDAEQVFDYLHVRADGAMEGNETGKWIRKVQEGSQKGDQGAGSGVKAASEAVK